MLRPLQIRIMVWEVDPTRWFRDVKTNLYDSFLVSRVVVGWIVARRRSYMINIVSSCGVEVYQDLLDRVLPYPVGNTHPSIWDWVIGTGTASGALVELLAATMNTNTGGPDHHSAVYVEKQVREWLEEILGYPASASGLLTSGCSAANLIGLAVTRNAMTGYDLRREGV